MTPLGPISARIRNAFRSSGPLWTASLLLDRVGFGTLRFWPRKTVAAELLARQVGSILRGLGMSEEHASITTEYLMYADLRDIDSHGASMIRSYHRQVVDGLLTMQPKIEVIRESETTALIDGGGGLGHVPADMAMKLAIQKCEKLGLGAVAVRNSGHYGAAGAYALLASRAGFVGIATTNTARPAVVPTFGVQAMLGTNPIAFAAPAGHNSPFLLDMATSTVPLGKIMMATHSGRSIPEGWAIDATGQPVTNARRALKGRMLTPLGSNREMGSHKGYGLAAAVEILSSVLSGLPPSPTSGKNERRAGHFFLALNPRQFREDGEFETDLNAMMDSLRNCKPLNSRQPVLVAGDPEHAAFAERSRSGIPISRSVIEDLRAVCKASGVPFLVET